MLTVHKRAHSRFQRRRKLNEATRESPILVAGGHPPPYPDRSMQFIRGDPDWQLTARQHHEAYSGRNALLGELPLVGRMHLLDALPDALVPHAHPAIYEAHFVVDGCLSFRAREQDFDVTGGMVFLTKPGEIH